MPVSKPFIVKLYLENETIATRIKTWDRVRAVKYALDELAWYGILTVHRIEVEEEKMNKVE